MRDILIMGLLGLGMYVFARIMLKEPILPWKQKKPTTNKVNNKSKKTSTQEDMDSSKTFQELFSDIQGIQDHMIKKINNQFVLVASVEPVNYFLLSQDEQESIDISFETWLAQINYPVQFYLQNRYIDLSEPIESMRKNMKDEDLDYTASEYGQAMIEDLMKWQAISPRYETKRFLVFHHQIDSSEIKTDTVEELEEKILEKAFAELYRRFNTAKSSLRKAGMDLELLTNEDLGELLYYAFNRRKAVKNKYKDVALKEQMALYVTADQKDYQIEAVKELIDNESESSSKKEENKAG